MSDGSVALHRQIQDHWLWKGEVFTKGQAWIDLVLSANHKDARITIKGQIVAIKRGQQARSELTLSKTWGWSRGKVRRFLGTLENDSMIVQQTGHLTSIITICNYNDFQSISKRDGTTDRTGDGTPDGTTDGHLTVHKQQCNNENNENKKDLNTMSSASAATVQTSTPVNSKPTVKKRPHKDDAKTVIDYLNQKTSSRYEHVDSNLKPVESILMEGRTIDQVTGVIDRKCTQWLSDPKMSKYLRPLTLFNKTKFATYLGEADHKNNSDDELRKLLQARNAKTEIKDTIEGECKHVH